VRQVGSKEPPQVRRLGDNADCLPDCPADCTNISADAKVFSSASRILPMVRAPSFVAAAAVMRPCQPWCSPLSPRCEADCPPAALPGLSLGAGAVTPSQQSQPVHHSRRVPLGGSPLISQFQHF
jgi:hypothetical protein